jgi:hypothetical protein
VKHPILWLLIVLVLSGCSQIDSIPTSPLQTPETWLAIQPVARIPVAGQDLILVQPSTSAIVFLLGFLTIGVGLYFLRICSGQLSRGWWGVALLLWGVGALLAGVSYEAFSYQIKCSGRAACVWTSWWELAYLVLSVASIDAMVLAQAHSCATGRLRKALSLYALINLALYVVAVLVGALVPVKFLISFELLILAAAPSILIFFVLNGWRYYKLRTSMDLALLGAWAWLTLTIGAYFAYYLSGLTQTLWAQGKWFSENDVLHIGLILWMIYLALVVAPRVRDESEVDLVAAGSEGSR